MLKGTLPEMCHPGMISFDFLFYTQAPETGLEVRFGQVT